MPVKLPGLERTSVANERRLILVAPAHDRSIPQPEQRPLPLLGILRVLLDDRLNLGDQLVQLRIGKGLETRRELHDLLDLIHHVHSNDRQRHSGKTERIP
jgi:hypothetical protein